MDIKWIFTIIKKSLNKLTYPHNNINKMSSIMDELFFLMVKSISMLNDLRE